MFRNYLITALRNFTRHKLYSFINIAGLTVGLACAIFIILFVRDELSYDKWIPGTENLYRVEHLIQAPSRTPITSAHTPFPVPQAMLERLPQVRARTRVTRNQVAVLVDNRVFAETMDSVDPNFFQVIKLPFVAGNPASVLADPDSVVLSEKMSRKYFGGTQALGKTITISDEHCDDDGQNCQTRKNPLVVTGIFRDLPHNTQLAADLVMSNISKADPNDQENKVNWLNFSTWGYVQLARGADPDQVTATLKALLDQSVNPSRMIKLKVSGSQLMGAHLTPFVDDHLSSDKDEFSGMTPAGSWTTVYGFIAIGMLILLVACFNFTNLATARAMVRAREISLRKVVGATRRQLAVQFLGESVLMAMIALVLALCLTELLLPLFDRFLGTPIAFDYLADWPLLLLVACIGVAVGLLSGIYPALVLSGIRPMASLRTNASRQSGSGLLRTALVVLQFAVSIGLGIAVLVVFAQISHARHQDLGFHKDGVLVVNGNDLSPSGVESFAKALRANPDIEDVAISDGAGIPFNGAENDINVGVPGSAMVDQIFRVSSIGPGYAQVYGVHLLAGRFLSEQHGADAVTEMHGTGINITMPPFNILVNETGSRRLGYSAKDAIGKVITVHNTPATIVGVIADLKVDGANQQVAPTLYWYVPVFSRQISARVRGEHLQDTLAFVDRTWHGFAPSAVIARRFLNADFERQFLADERQGDIFGLFVGIAIFIAALGLFGLAAFSTERRTKEIGLRKTFGARTRDIVLMLLWQFSIPVLIANLIAWPVAYYYLHGWLESYAYRVSLSPLYFIGVGLAALIIAWATVFVHAQRVARANPIHALRYE
jgi:putative ABC transport system permease protein